MMVTLIMIAIATIAFVIVAGYLGYVFGFDDGFETAIEMYEKELEDVQSKIDIQ